jgi:hypothetical protein
MKLIYKPEEFEGSELENNISKTGSVLRLHAGGRIRPTMLGRLERANLSHRTSFGTVVFSSYLEFQTMDKFHTQSDPDCTNLFRICGYVTRFLISF